MKAISGRETTILAAALAASGMASLQQGRDLNFDLLHYHFYVGYALLQGRLDHDIAPAGIGTFLNPTVHVLHYLGMTWLPPRAWGFLLGAVHGLNFYLVYRIARSVLVPGASSSVHLALLAGVLAATRAGPRSLLGTSFADVVVSIPALLGVLMLVTGAEGPAAASGRRLLPRLLLAGLFGGTATGLKLTAATSHVALGAGAVLLAVRRRDFLRGLGVFAAGSLAGLLLGGGYWGIQLWKRFGNPVFPFWNDIFVSPLFPTSAIRDRRWAAEGWADYLSMPLDAALGATSRLQEVPFREACFLFILVAGAAWMLRRLRQGRSPDLAFTEPARILLLCWLTLYLVWTALFHYYRYFVVGELLAPVVLLLPLVPAAGRWWRLTAAATALTLILTTSTGSWGRYPWTDSWFRVRLPAWGQDPNAVVLMDGAGTSFLIPFFPRQTRFFGILDQSRGFYPLIAAQVAAHRGPVLRLGHSWESTVNVRRFGLRPTDDCALVKTGARMRFWLCRLAPAPM